MIDKRMDLVLDTGISMSKEKDRNILLYTILDSSMKIANCDAGTLYTVGDDVLEFKVTKTISLGVTKGQNGEKIDYPPVPLRESHLCAYSVIHQKSINIPDVYTSDLFDFSGPRKYDALLGYKTVSMLAIPLINQERKTVGVMQLINAMDETGAIVPFTEENSKLIFALASQAAIAISNINYLEEMKNQMWSFAEAMAEAIDNRTPYNANHIRNVAKYCGLVADYINLMHSKGLDEDFFSKERREALVMSALLHDVGKMVTPTRVMNKATKLGAGLDALIGRAKIIALGYRIALLEGTINKEEFHRLSERLSEAVDFTKKVNENGFLSEEARNKLLDYYGITETVNGEEISLYDQESKELLLIQKGTLSPAERNIMENHVVMTAQILSRVQFSGEYESVPKYAAMHHEYLDGSGYPCHLKGADFPLEAKILAVADICDALLATDRPYKKPMSREKAFEIMYKMADEGKLERKIVQYLEAALLKSEAEVQE